MNAAALKALIVDDERPVRDLTERWLKRVGFECATAADGKQAECILETDRFDVVVTDLRMPVEHGYALAAMLMAREDRPLVVVLTGVYEPRLAKEMKRLGVDEMVFKPVDYPDFARKVRRLVDQRQSKPDGGSSEPRPTPTADGPSREERPCRSPAREKPPRVASATRRTLQTRRAAAAIRRRSERERRPRHEERGSIASSAAPGNESRTPENAAELLPSAATATRTAPSAAPPSARPFQAAAATAPLQSTATPLPVGQSPVYVASNPVVLAPRGSKWALLVVPFGLLTVISFWLGVQATLFLQQRQTIKQVEALGAKVVRSEQGKLHVHFTADANTAALLHLHRLNYLYALDASRSRVRDDDLVHLARLPDLRQLSFAHTAITDQGLEHLRDLNLETLNLRGTEVSDDGLAHLLQSNQLDEVDVNDTAVTAQGLNHLRSAFPNTQFHYDSDDAPASAAFDPFGP